MGVRKIDNRRDILLLLLYSPGTKQNVNEPITGRTRIVKMLFLFQKEALPHFRRGTAINEDNFYQFFAWKFGPFSREVYDDLTFFTLRGFIETDDATEDALPESAAEWDLWLTSSDADLDEPTVVDYNEQLFRLTSKGQQYAATLYETLTTQQKTLLREFKKKFQRTPLRAILEYVYEEYQEMTEKSEIREKILGSRERQS